MKRIAKGWPGLVVGALIGTFWWLAYAPSAHSLGLLAVSHGVAGFLFQTLVGLLIPRWRSLGSTLGGVVGALFVGPLFVVMPYAWGWLAGTEGLLSIGLAVAVGALLGLELGRQGLRGALALAALAGMTIWLNAASIDQRDTPTRMAAPNVVSDFPDQPVAIIGIDGADWRVVSPMLEREALPNLASLISRGRHGVLRSIEPTLSPVVWTTIFSGQPAEVHGLRDWATSDNRNRRVPMLWDLFGAHDRSSLVVNVPGTWPPAPIENGRILAGFPIPGIVSGGRGQLLGTLLTSDPAEDGAVTTARAQTVGDETFEFDFPIAAPRLEPRLRGVSHALIDAATQDRLIPVENDSLAGRLRIMPDHVELLAERIEGRIELPRDAWSDWIRLELSDGAAVVRARVIDAESDRIRIYFTPAFQDPVDARYPFAGDIDPDLLEGLSAPYVVEGVGWRAHRDERLAYLLPEALADIERTHADAALAALERETPDLFAYAITLTDRIQHPFWRDHRPELYAPRFAPHAGFEGHDPVEAAYRVADGLLGEFVGALPSDTLVFVVSDHGVAPALDQGEGGHRVEGIWVAAGGAIESSSEPDELSILDLVPTVLHCAGAPAAEDMPGRAVTSLCPDAEAQPRIATYRSEAGPIGAGTTEESLEIDATREEQLRSLGYIE